MEKHKYWYSELFIHTHPLLFQYLDLGFFPRILKILVSVIPYRAPNKMPLPSDLFQLFPMGRKFHAISRTKKSMLDTHEQATMSL